MGVAVGIAVGVGIAVLVVVGVGLGNLVLVVVVVGVGIDVLVVVVVGDAVGSTVGVGAGPAWATADQTVTAIATMTRVPTAGRRIVAFDTVLLLMRETSRERAAARLYHGSIGTGCLVSAAVPC